MSGLPPGARPVDPDAEIERLVRERAKAAVAMWPVICDEIITLQVPPHETRPVRIRVSAEYPPSGVPADLGQRLAQVVRACWPQENGGE
jgi:hypothetical protein